MSRTERAPTTEELYSDGPHFSTGTYEVGNSDFSTERATTVEGSLRKRRGRLTGSVSAFITDYDDFLYLAPIGEERLGLPVFHYRQQSAKFHGGEIETQWTAWQSTRGAIQLDMAADLVRARSTDGPLPRIPPWSVLGGAEYQHSLGEARIEVRYVASQQRVTDMELPTDSYTLLNAHLNLRPFSELPAVVTLRAHNLLNKEARNHVSFRKDRVPLPGRDLRVQIRWSF